MKSICAEFHLTVADVEQKLAELGVDGFLLERGTNRPMPIVYHRIPPGLHLNRFYFAMASLILKKVENVLEIGTGTAESTIVFSKLFSKAIIYTIDLPEGDLNYKKLHRTEFDPERKKLCQYNLDRKNIVFIEKNSFFLPSLNLPDKFELILVDGEHNYPQVAGDLMFAYSRIADGGFMFMHDYKMCDHVGQAVDWMAKRVPERISFFPQVTPPDMLDTKMALLVKGRFKIGL